MELEDEIRDEAELYGPPPPPLRWTWSDATNPLLWAVALLSLLLLALYFWPIVVILRDPGYGSLPVRLVAAAGLVPLLLFGYLLLFFAGGALGPESEPKVRRKVAEFLMIVGILPWLLLAFWHSGFGGRNGNGDRRASEGGSEAPATNGGHVDRLRSLLAPRIG